MKLWATAALDQLKIFIHQRMCPLNKFTTRNKKVSNEKGLGRQLSLRTITKIQHYSYGFCQKEPHIEEQCLSIIDNSQTRQYVSGTTITNTSKSTPISKL